MLFVIIGHDSPDGARLRPQVRPAHLAYWSPLVADGSLKLGGPFTDGSGSLIIIETDSEQRAIALAHDDPYVRQGVFERVEIRPFRKVLPEPGE